MGKLDILKSIRDEINISIEGSENINYNTPNLFVSNHNCLMDIFYLPMSIDVPIVDMISARLIYKKVYDRQKMVNDYLYSMPIEAHGGKIYSDVCLESGVNLLNSGISIGIFPEGAYLNGNNIYRGRTGASRILFGAIEKGIKVNLVPVGINISGNYDLDSYDFDDRTVNIEILPNINCDNWYDMFKESNTFFDKNNALHGPIDTCMKKIADALGRPYVNDYIELYPKGNVIFSNGDTVLTDLAQSEEFINEYEIELNTRMKTMKKEILKNEMARVR